MQPKTNKNDLYAVLMNSTAQLLQATLPTQQPKKYWQNVKTKQKSTIIGCEIIVNKHRL